MEIREATEADQLFLKRLCDDVLTQSDDRWVEDWPRENEAGVIAEEGGEPVGAAWYRWLPAVEQPTTKVPRVIAAVLPEAREKDVGTGLLNRLSEVAVAHDVRILQADVKPTNEVALGLARKCGYQEKARDSQGVVVLLRSEDPAVFL